MQNRIRAILVTMLAVLPAMAVGQEQPDLVVISGRVTDARFAAIEKATVTLRAVGAGEPIATVQAKSDGTFTFPALPPKAYELRFERIGFVPVTMEAGKAMGLGVVVMQIGEATEGWKVEARPPRQIIPPRAIKKIEPEYAARAKAAGLEGTAIVRMVVDENGLPQDVTFVGFHRRTEVIPDPLGLDEAAVAAIQKWRFQPSTRDGVPTPATETIVMNFRLPASGATPK
jgi:TonB family protein